MKFEGVITGLNGYFTHATEGVPKCVPYRLKIKSEGGKILYVFKTLSRVSFKLQDPVAGEYLQQTAPDLCFVHRLARLKTAP